MSHIPVEKHTGHKRPLSEGDRARQKKQQEKSDWNRRHGHKPTR